MKTYSKPEVAVLGDAVVLVQSSKPSYGESGDPMRPNTAFEED